MVSATSQLLLWVLQPVFEATVAWVMFRRKLHKDFPAFFSFQIAQIVIFFIEFSVHRWAGYSAYFYTFWALSAVRLGFAFKIIHEVFLDVFRPYHALKDLGSALFKWASVVMLLVSIVLVSLRPGWQDPLAETVLVIQRGVRTVQCGMFFFLLAFCKSLGISRRSLSFGIALGCGLFASTELVSLALFSGQHVGSTLVNASRMAGYNVALLLWLGYCFLNRREARMPVLIPQRWNEALMDIHPQAETESLIPMFEHMVDRAFSKTHDHHV
jgi:hypothetical protein